MELMEILILVVGLSILLILSYYLFSQASSASSTILFEETQYEKITSFTSNFFYTRIPGIDKTISQLLADRIVSDNDVVYYGEQYGGLNVTKIIHDYFNSYFSNRWNLSISVNAKIVYSVLWIPNSYTGNSISKIDIKDGTEKGRYSTVPAGIYGNPSRVAVDSKGNVWVGNRGTRTLVKIGLSEADECIDRNGNGVIDTSEDSDKDGIITPYETYPFGDDECLLANVFLGGSDYGNFDAEGVRAVCTDKQDNVYAGLFGERKLFYVSKDGDVLKEWSSIVQPYGCFVDDKGIVWISSAADPVNSHKLERFDPSTENFQVFDIGHTVYGIAPCFNEDCLVINGWGDMKLTKLNTTTNQIIFDLDKPELLEGRGLTMDENNDIYAVSSAKNLIVKYDKDGNEIVRAATCGKPTGVGIDAFGKIWTTCIESVASPSAIKRFTKNLVPEIKSVFGSAHYVYNFFTSYNLQPIVFEKHMSFGYDPKANRIRTFIIKLPLPQPNIGGVVNVFLRQW